MAKLKKLLWGLAAIPLLVGCAKDDLLPDPEKTTADGDRMYFVSLNIRGDVGAGTRAYDEDNPYDPTKDPEFDNGTDESNVEGAYFVFYDDAGQYISQGYVNLEKVTPVTTTENASIERYYQSTVGFRVEREQQLPTQAVCYINPISPQALNNNLDKIQETTRKTLFTTKDTGERYFAMSNSVYYNPDGNPDDGPIIAVSVKGKLFDTEDEAKAVFTSADPETRAKVVDFYVERYAAKLKFSKPEVTAYKTSTRMIGSTDDIPVTLTFKPSKWALNASCESSFIVKSFGKETNGLPLGENYTYSELNNIINAQELGEGGVPSGLLTAGNEWKWNSAGFFRSYWAMSPAYFTPEYPAVSDDVEFMKGPLHQKYYSYNDLAGGAGYDHDNEDFQYFHETTVGARGIMAENAAAATPSVILVGDYELNVNGTPYAAKSTTFYTYVTGTGAKPLVYFEAEGPEGLSAIAGGESMLRRFIYDTKILYKKLSGAEDEYVEYDPTKTADMTALVAVLEIGDLSPEVKAAKDIPERYRALQFKKGVTIPSDMYVYTADGFKAIGDGDGKIKVDEVNSLLIEDVGYCNMYNMGAAYFNIPVKHLGWYRKGNTQMKNQVIDWNKVRVGDFGVVRNHSYDIQVSKIEGLATGIGGKDKPILPPKSETSYFVAYRVNILKWALVPAQTVEL